MSGILEFVFDGVKESVDIGLAFLAILAFLYTQLYEFCEMPTRRVLRTRYFNAL